MLEKAVEIPTVKRAEKDGWFARKVEWPGRIGAPDRVFIRAGRTVWIEFKAPGKVPRRSQTLEHDRMREAGAEVYVADSVDKAMRYLQEPLIKDPYIAALEEIACGHNDPRRLAQEVLGWQ